MLTLDAESTKQNMCVPHPYQDFPVSQSVMKTGLQKNGLTFTESFNALQSTHEHDLYRSETES